MVKVIAAPGATYGPRYGAYGTAILAGLGKALGRGVRETPYDGPVSVVTERSVYGGTVAYSEKQRRRAANRVARKSRRVNRKVK